MLTTDMSAVQQRTKKLQQIISEVTLDETKLQTAFECQVYDSDARKISFLKTFSKQYGGNRQSPSVNSTRSSLDAASRPKVPRSEYQSKTTSSGSLRRTLVIFVRHFLCGYCQEYLMRLSSHPSLSRSNLSKHNVSVTLIGCGSPSHVSSYRALTKLPNDWAMYADPSTELYNLLGMQRSLKLGDRRPVYIERTFTGNMLRSVVQGVKRMPKGDVAKAGAWDVNGGEFLFEWQDDNEEWRLRWCHQMENSRDHTEVEDLIGILGLQSMPSSPTSPILRDNRAMLHGRSQSTPLIIGSMTTPVGKAEVQAPLKRKFSLRQSLSTRRQSWLVRSTSSSTSLKRRSHAEIAT